MNSSYHSISLGSGQGWFHKIQIESREPPPTLLAPSPNPPLTIFLETLLRNFWEHFEKRGSRSHGPPSSPFSRPRILSDSHVYSTVPYTDSLYFSHLWRHWHLFSGLSSVKTRSNGTRMETSTIQALQLALLWSCFPPFWSTTWGNKISFANTNISNLLEMWRDRVAGLVPLDLSENWAHIPILQ